MPVRAAHVVFKAGLAFLFGERLLLLHHTGRVSRLDRQTVLEVVAYDAEHGLTACFLPPEAGAEIVAVYSRRPSADGPPPVRFIRLPCYGSEAVFLAAGRTIPFVRLDASGGYR